MKRILVVEDEFLVAARICDLLEVEGLEMIGPAGSLSEAVDLASREVLDGALLDVNVIGDRVNDVADILARRGVPFLFLTVHARDHLSQNFVDPTLVNAPFSDSTLMREVRLIGQLAAYGGSRQHSPTAHQIAQTREIFRGGTMFRVRNLRSRDSSRRRAAWTFWLWDALARDSRSDCFL